MNPNHKFKCLNIGLPDDILYYKTYGDFGKAIELIDKRLELDGINEGLKDSLLVQREIISRLPDNYPYNKEEALEKIREAIPGFTEEEFDLRVDKGEIDWIFIEGETYYFDRFYESLVKTDVNFRERAGIGRIISDGGSTSSEEQKDILDIYAEEMKEKSSLSKKITIRASLRVKDENFKKGKTYRVDLPIPCACPQQSKIIIEKMEPSTGELAPVDAAQRTVRWEERLDENIDFLVEYSYIYTADYNNLESIHPDKVQPSFNTNEKEPHIVFTPYIRELTKSLTQNLSSPLEKARAIYDYITLNVEYSFMRSYFCLENIAEKAALNLRGDCGVMTLLFITLCRCAGIPARWQSGLIARPDFCGAHDWAMFYIAPYGWLYADPSFGTGAVREENERRRSFYFGNLDPMRMVANSQFQADFAFEKKAYRADPYDNQLGEVEIEDRGLKYREFITRKEVIGFEDWKESK